MKENEAMKEIRQRDADRAVKDLVKEIRGEDVPERILELARALQAALDARAHDRK
ncbi:hypothetical protein [Shinella sp.]|uniref:hypothetical protein n=1 Tax=Shinella sp. TaxID=1870904 RepID=UPI0029B84714|nr:hypothetical protein [Shinella sp.]MDX3977440.1 hypothetical protein [Shinella sp.]